MHHMRITLAFESDMLPCPQVGTALSGTAAVALLPASAAVVVGAGAVGAAAGIVAHVATAPKEE